MTEVAHNQSVVIFAKDHIDREGSIVRSGMALAEAVLKSLEDHERVEVILDGVEGASSSYFNVFLRRIDEAIGLSAFEESVRVEMSSKIQQRVYGRSIDTLRRGQRTPANVTVPETTTQHGFFTKLFSIFLSREDRKSTPEKKS